MPESFKPYRHDLLRMHWNDERIILANPDILSETHVPPEIHARDAQMKEIALCVRPVTEGRKPLNCWLHGKPGVGKTATARWVLRKLDDEAGIRGVMRQNGEQGRRRRTLGTT
jgi:Cdc6-like AAA superfamily ATPase